MTKCIEWCRGREGHQQASGLQAGGCDAVRAGGGGGAAEAGGQGEGGGGGPQAGPRPYRSRPHLPSNCKPPCTDDLCSSGLVSKLISTQYHAW